MTGDGLSDGDSNVRDGLGARMLICGMCAVKDGYSNVQGIDVALNRDICVIKKYGDRLRNLVIR